MTARSIVGSCEIAHCGSRAAQQDRSQTSRGRALPAADAALSPRCGAESAATATTTHETRFFIGRGKPDLAAGINRPLRVHQRARAGALPCAWACTAVAAERV